MKKRRLRGDIGGALERHQPFTALDYILHGKRFPRFALIEKRHLPKVGKIERAAKTKEKKEVKCYARLIVFRHVGLGVTCRIGQ